MKNIIKIMESSKDKSILRKKLLSLRNNLSKEDVLYLSEQIINNLINLDIYNNSDVRLLFSSYGSEVKCELLFDETKNNYFPRVIDTSMEFYKVDDLSELKSGYKGILEPEISDFIYKNKKKDVIIVPGLVFSKSGYRIGYGKGFYDKYLSNKDLLKIGICYDFQLIDEFDNDTYDKQLDIIVTERDIYYINQDL